MRCHLRSPPRKRRPRPSLSGHPQTHCLSCEGARHTVPSPLVGEGQGEGYDTRGIRAVIRSISSNRCHFSIQHDEHYAQCFVATPLPVPPPQGGRERCGTALPPHTPSVRIYARIPTYGDDLVRKRTIHMPNRNRCQHRPDGPHWVHASTENQARPARIVSCCRRRGPRAEGGRPCLPS